MDSISLGILTVLHEHKEIQGTDELARLVNTRVEDLMRNVALLTKHGLINVEPSLGGRGKKTIYRDAGVLTVNRNGTS